MEPPSIFRLFAALVLGWLVPGAGHVLYGRRAKALYFGSLILLAFGVGLWLGDGLVVNTAKFGIYLVAQIWIGGPTLLTLEVMGRQRITHDIPFLDAGLLFTAVAGLLNLVVLVDLFETHLKERDAAKPAPSSAA
jgi:hypothetical protein